MRGKITLNKLMLPITLILPIQPKVTLDFVVDTGYEGFLTLPTLAVEALDLPFSHRIVVHLADDSRIHVSVHIASILWNGV